jgi:uncharacterized protein
MKIAIVGTGIAGNVVAHRLAREHDITVFEADARVGGHTNTVDVVAGGRRWAIDTGFIVFNDVTYPKFVALLDELGVASQPSDMSFSVSDRRSGLEYSGSSLNTLFAQRSNLLRPSFHRMLLDVLRFNREAPVLLEGGGGPVTLGEYLRAQGYSRSFVEHYILPMGAAIWSASPEGMSRMPAAFFVRFFHNHGLLSVTDRPQWRVIRGGSKRYVEKLVAGHRDRIRLNTPVHWIRRHPGYVEVKARGSEVERFDRVFLACHSDQALRLLTDPSPQEREVLGAIAYQRNEAVLHTDTALLPRRRRAWAAWNYLMPAHDADADGAGERKVTLTYNMNILQGLDAATPFCVTLNDRGAIHPDRVIQRMEYAHPLFTERAVAAQQRHREIDGARRTYYCGAYWRYGFHEDGVVSALDALRHFRDDRPGSESEWHEQRYLLRAG